MAARSTRFATPQPRQPALRHRPHAVSADRQLQCLAAGVSPTGFRDELSLTTHSYRTATNGAHLCRDGGLHCGNYQQWRTNRIVSSVKEDEANDNAMISELPSMLSLTSSAVIGHLGVVTIPIVCCDLFERLIRILGVGGR